MFYSNKKLEDFFKKAKDLEDSANTPIENAQLYKLNVIKVLIKFL